MHVYKPPPVGGLDRVPVFTAGTGSTLADLFELDGVTPMPDNVLVADTHGNLPSFQCATSPVYVGVSGSRTTWTPSESGEPSAASSALSATKLARVVADLGTPLPITHGTAQTNVNWTGATIVKGAAYWGVPRSALDLNVTIVGGGVTLPAEDVQYDIQANLALACAVADAGKLIGGVLGGNAHSVLAYAPVNADGSVTVTLDMTDQWFTGDLAFAPTIELGVDARFLTVNAAVTSATLVVLQR